MEKKSSVLGCFDVKAFTLIELLVVVLIIGILAAVALPQYQKAVEKSRATQAITLLRSLGQGIVACQLATGGKPSSFDELDLDMSAWTGNTKWADNYNVLDTRSNDEWSLQLYKDNSGAMQLYLGRLSGKYRGGGFNYQVLDETGQFTGNLLCAERTSEGIVFKQSKGAYCKGILGATPFSVGSCRWYKMPQ